MSETTETAPRAALRDRSIQARRAARLIRAKREQRIVEFLNRGVSIAEIAAREGVTEKRMRAIVRECLARRMPAPPAEFLALQVSRLNEALLVAYSAMSGANLHAVDRVVKIVRELDRYHGLFVSPERRSSASEPRLEAPAQSPLALAAPPRACPEMAPQTAEMLQSAPADGAHCRARSMTAPRPGQRPGPTVQAPPTRPELAPQTLESVQSAPADGAHCRARSMTAPRPGQRPGPTDGTESRSEAAADTSPTVQAPPTSPQMAPEPLDTNETAPANGGVAGEALTQLERELASGIYAPPSTNPDGSRRVNLRATPNGVMAS